MPGSRVESELADRVAALRSRLLLATDYASAFVALSDADGATLREVEKDYTMLPGPLAMLRERIAEGHVATVKAKLPTSTQQVGLNDIVGWAQDALALFFSGVTDPLSDGRGQYLVELVTPPPHPGAAAVYQVSTTQGRDPRRFLVAVGVKELVA